MCTPSGTNDQRTARVRASDFSERSYISQQIIGDIPAGDFDSASIRRRQGFPAGVPAGAALTAPEGRLSLGSHWDVPGIRVSFAMRWTDDHLSLRVLCVERGACALAIQVRNGR
jgi:hypothetical protein